MTALQRKTCFCNFLVQVIALFCSFFMKEQQQSQDAFILGGLAREKAQTSISVPILSLTGGAWESYLTSLNLSF